MAERGRRRRSAAQATAAREVEARHMRDVVSEVEAQREQRRRETEERCEGGGGAAQA
jgi:hypothetical protein